MEDILLNYWRLRNHPFLPKCGPDGKEINEKLFEGTLDPGSDERLVHYYFDVYDWSKSQYIKGLCRKNIFETFDVDDRIDSEAPLLILICGANWTGCKSLRSLILYRLASSNPLKVDVEIFNRNISDTIKHIANRFIRVYAQATKESRQELESLMAAEIQSQPHAQTLLLELGYAMTEKGFTRPVVINVQGQDVPEIWESIYDNAKNLCKYIVVNTGNVALAEACYRNMLMSKKNVMLIKAEKMKQEKAEAFLKDRMFEERSAGYHDNELAPFTKESLAAMFEAGKSTSGDVVLPVGRVRKAFRAAIDLQLKSIAAALQEGKSAEALKAEDRILINAQTMKDAWIQVNAGKI